MPTSTRLRLPGDARAALESLARSHRGRADEARRARIILLLADGYSYATICERIDCTPQTIATWKARYEAAGLAGLRGRHRGSKPRVLTPQLEARILSWTRKPPTDGTTHWSTRRLGDRLGVPHTIVQRAWPSVLTADVPTRNRATSSIGFWVDERPRRTNGSRATCCSVPGSASDERHGAFRSPRESRR